MIDSTDPRLTLYRLVGDRAALEREGLFVAEGRLVVERLLEDGRFAVHSLLVTPTAAAALHGVLERRSDVEVHVCTPDVLREITGFNFHRGCLALAHRQPDSPVASALPLAAKRVLALEGVTDPDNVGGLFRTAFALGVDAVILDRASADPLYRKAIRTSMAATLRLPFVRVPAWTDGLASLRAAGFTLVALTPDAAATPLAGYRAEDDARLVIVVGSEASGMSRESLALADVRLRIHIDPRADSLNVVSAAAIALHALRHR
jgi:tRNA G18 (ribose-2'-O)-methylase SpoU